MLEIGDEEKIYITDSRDTFYSLQLSQISLRLAMRAVSNRNRATYLIIQQMWITLSKSFTVSVV